MTRPAPRVCPLSWPALIALAWSSRSVAARTSDSAAVGQTAAMTSMCISFAQAVPTQVRHHDVAQRARSSANHTPGVPRRRGRGGINALAPPGVALHLISIFPATILRYAVPHLPERAMWLHSLQRRCACGDSATIVSLLRGHFLIDNPSDRVSELDSVLNTC